MIFIGFGLRDKTCDGEARRLGIWAEGFRVKLRVYGLKFKG